MEKTAVVVVTHRGISDETRSCIRALDCPSLVELKGNANIVKARSLAFDTALRAIEGTPIETLLCIDDDMTFLPAAARELVVISRKTDFAPTSGFCLRKDGSVAARPWKNGRWLTGLAFMAVPVRGLVGLRKMLPAVGNITQWCGTGMHPHLPGEWVGEDFWFCLHFGGVELVPIPAGHLKWVPIVPDAESMRLVLERRGVSAPQE